MRSIAFAAGCLAVLTQAALGQETPLLLPGDPGASAQLSRIIESTAAAGLPVNPILSKVQYGRVMRSPPARIVATAGQIAARLEDARAALAPNPTDLDIAAGADALGENAKKDDLQKIRRAGRGRSVAGPLGVLAQLLASGVEREKATEAVTDLMKRGATDGQLVALGNDVSGDVAARVHASFDTRVQGLAAVLSPGGAVNADAAFAPSTAGGSLTGTRANPPVPPKRP